MKTLVESLFDKDLIKRKLVFGDLYKPTNIMYGSRIDLTEIGDMFNMSKLKKDVEPINLDNVAWYGANSRGDKGKFLEYVLAKVNTSHPDVKFIEATQYDRAKINGELEDLFKKYIETPTGNSENHSIEFDMSKSKDRPLLHIFKSTPTDYYQILIEYDLR